jgi:hypothetical protein
MIIDDPFNNSIPFPSSSSSIPYRLPRSYISLTAPPVSITAHTETTGTMINSEGTPIYVYSDKPYEPLKNRHERRKEAALKRKRR